MGLSKRLETIVSMVPELGAEGCVADVGTDHGFVPIRLVELGLCGRALAMDVRPGPLERAREHIRQHGLEGRIETRLGDGLERLRPGEAQAVVIAGMGGELMLRILKEGAHVRGQVAHWILSPQSELSRFRHGLEEMGLCIREESMVLEDGKYYTVLDVIPGEMHYQREYQYRYGDCLIRKNSPVLREFLEREMEKNRRIRERLESLGRGEHGKRQELLGRGERGNRQEFLDDEGNRLESLGKGERGNRQESLGGEGIRQESESGNENRRKSGVREETERRKRELEQEYQEMEAAYDAMQGCDREAGGAGAPEAGL